MGTTLQANRAVQLAVTLMVAAPAARPLASEDSMAPNPSHPAANQLAGEKSPYLLQHAHNPVHWHPWGEAAFARARKENKPIFLSVGYSTCHWCHVMERESFENDAIAKILNAHFVAIKVDREERPDVDRVYMTYVQAMTGHGGWPMSVWLTPGLKPFHGGTYFPPDAFEAILLRIAEFWTEERGRLAASGDEVTRQLKQLAEVSADRGVKLDPAILDTGYRQIRSSHDPQQGGFGGAPKFPRPVLLNFLVRYYARTGARDALDMTLLTLRKMADGGIHDRLGGGFHRYSVDGGWHVPHFEKMLYDQAQLACSYLEAYQITRDPFFADIARDILDYVVRDMTGTDGQFFSAEDADSPVPGRPGEHAEGAFYVWEQREIVEALGKEQADVFNDYYGVGPKGNAPSDPQGEFRDKNILIVRRPVEETAGKWGKSVDEIRDLLAVARSRLLKIRLQRPRPHLDDKTLTAWNGLMISAFARATQVLDEPGYLRAAKRAADFVEARLSDRKTGRLMRRYRDGEAAIDGFADDYAFLIQGLVDLYEASFEVKYLTWAIELQHTQNKRFWDAAGGGGYFSTAGDDASILLRMKEDYDGAEPSPNSIAALNLLRLAQMTDSKEFHDLAGQTLGVFGGRMTQAPGAIPQMLAALCFHLDRPGLVVMAGSPGARDTRGMLGALHSRFIPNKSLLLADGGAGQETLARSLGFVKGMGMVHGRAAAYVCRDHVCQLPTTNAQTMIEGLLGP